MSKVPLTRLPELWIKAEKFKNEDDNFKDICKNYEEACQMLLFLKNQPVKTKELIDEYDILVNELEMELLTEINILSGSIKINK